MRDYKKVLTFFVFVTAIAILLSACGGSTQGASSSTTKVTPTATATTAPTAIPKPAHFGQSVVQIVQELKAQGFPIGKYFNYTASNDANLLLGRPGQYTGKLNFKDTRISSTEQGADMSVSDGGSIEVFANTTDAQHRFAYIQGISKSGNALFAEYEYLDGVAILRLSAQLTPDQAAKYEKGFKALP